MNKTILVAVALLVCVSASAGSLSDNQPKEKRSNRSIGASLMGKTFKCNGVSMSYLISEQGTMAFGASIDFEYEKMLGKTPLGIATGIWAEYSRPYYSGLNDSGQQVQMGANDITLRVPVMIQYHDKLSTSTELLLFAGPSVDFVVFRKGSGNLNSDAFIFGGTFSGGPANWRWIGLSFNYGIGITYNDLTFKLSTGYGLTNHFKKDYTAQAIGYPVYINHPVVGTLMFSW